MRNFPRCWQPGREGAASQVPKMMRVPAARTRQRGFFDFSVTELAIIFGLALVVLGPKKLPGLVAQIGRWVGRARHMARQFREQLEQEVNSINEVKPVPRHVPPVAPTTPAPEVAAAESPPATVVDHPPAPEPTVAPEGPPAAAAPPADPHPEAQIYFFMNGTQPEAVAENPYAPPEAMAAASDVPAAATAAPEAAAADSAEPASVKVIFPHDHG